MRVILRPYMGAPLSVNDFWPIRCFWWRLRGPRKQMGRNPGSESFPGFPRVQEQARACTTRGRLRSPVARLSDSKRDRKRASGYEFLSFLSRGFDSKFFMELTWNRLAR